MWKNAKAAILRLYQATRRSAHLLTRIFSVEASSTAWVVADTLWPVRLVLYEHNTPVAGCRITVWPSGSGSPTPILSSQERLVK